VLTKILFIIILSASLLTVSQAETVFHDIEGKPAAAYKNKWIIVNYWAPWCEACHQEVPELNRFSANMQTKNVAVYGVDMDLPERERLLIATNQTGLTYPVLTQDPGDLWKLGEVSVLPTSFIVNPEGIVVKKIVGAVTETELMQDLQQLHAVL
jgi:thiol-disulfide isomerase/thioredoxin